MIKEALEYAADYAPALTSRHASQDLYLAALDAHD